MPRVPSSRPSPNAERIAKLYAQLDALMDDVLLEDMADAVKRARIALDVDRG